MRFEEPACVIVLVVKFELRECFYVFLHVTTNDYLSKSCKLLPMIRILQ